MDRREFLRSLICAGVAAGLPLPVGMGVPEVEWAFHDLARTGDALRHQVVGLATFPDGHRQVFARDSVVTGCMRAVSETGCREEMAYQAVKRMREVSRDIAVVNRDRLGLPREIGGRPVWRGEADDLWQKGLRSLA